MTIDLTQYVKPGYLYRCGLCTEFTFVTGYLGAIDYLTGLINLDVPLELALSDVTVCCEYEGKQVEVRLDKAQWAVSSNKQLQRDVHFFFHPEFENTPYSTN